MNGNKMCVLMVGACLTLGLSGCKSGAVNMVASGWQCEADGMVTASYSGGSSAYVHLEGYRNGNNYRVTRQSDTKVTGVTGNDTSFQCIKA